MQFFHMNNGCMHVCCFSHFFFLPRRLRREVLEKFRAAVRGVSEAVDHRTGRATLEPRRAFDEIDADGGT